MSEHAVTRCDQCGQLDDHPKSHWSTGETYHHDCLPYDKKKTLYDTSEHGKAIVEAAESGLHGEELRQHILSLHQEAGK